ncbi:class I SAM-dependent methyltransferase [Micromonospora sp. LOL_024]|uniref:class I SAM-dependent methyltransferase n=1 Tax=Micromonospora sp. LOL_024 TaxID=3345412 RepID=UPI003A8B4D3B
MTNAAAQGSVAEVFEWAAPTYDRTGVSFFGPLGAELVRRAGIRPGDQVLDVGCGRGAVLFPAAEATGPTGHVTGIDLAPAMVTLTAGDAARAGLSQVAVLVDDAQRPDFPPRSLDAVLAGLVVFLLPDPQQALRSYARLLRPSGRLAVSTFAAQDPAFVAAMAALAAHLPADQPRPTSPDHLFADETRTGATMAAAGLTVTEVGEHRIESRFRDVDHWMEWLWSHAGRALLGRVPATRLDAATADAARALDDARTPNGDLCLRTTVRITVATPAASI